jgi:CHAT domain-containing protein
VVHFAAHGDFPEMNPLDEHALLLSPAHGDDGRLTAHDLAEMELQQLGIAVLNVCNGAVYRVGPGDEPYGLAAAMITAGAENIVAPLWPIADDFARTTAVAFADRIAGTSTVASALQYVVNRLSKTAALVDWAAYCLIGSGRQIDWSTSTQRQQ